MLISFLCVLVFYLPAEVNIIIIVVIIITITITFFPAFPFFFVIPPFCSYMVYWYMIYQSAIRDILTEVATLDNLRKLD